MVHMNVDEITGKLKSFSNPKNVEGMARFGINPEKALGIGIPILRKMAMRIGKNHRLAGQLWKSDIHEARILAGMIDDPEKVTEAQMERWVKGFNSWDLCDQVCGNLFDRTTNAMKKAYQWSGRKEEFVKRAGFAIVACRVRHMKDSPDKEYIEFLDVIKREAADSRNYVKKAVNWALRQIGKRNRRLRKAAVESAREIGRMDDKTARWIAKDALKELESYKVKRRLAK